MAKEVSVRLHEELERLETKRTKQQEELERTKRLLDESEDRRLSLQKEVNSVTNEVHSTTIHNDFYNVTTNERIGMRTVKIFSSLFFLFQFIFHNFHQ